MTQDEKELINIIRTSSDPAQTLEDAMSLLMAYVNNPGKMPTEIFYDFLTEKATSMPMPNHYTRALELARIG